MKPKMPPVKDFMSSIPKTISADSSLNEAKRLMKEHQIRHLPVLVQGKITGMLDSLLLKEALLANNGAGFTVSDVMMPGPYTVSCHAPLDEVLSEMVREKCSYALVQNGEETVGIFTTTDACEGYKELLRETFSK